MNINRQVLIDTLCLIIGPMLLVGTVVKEWLGDSTGAVIGIGLIMAGVMYRRWKKEGFI